MSSNLHTTSETRSRPRGLQTAAIWLIAILTLCIITALLGLTILDRATAPWAQEAELRTIRIESQIERERAVTQS